jgi:hypothetical protein
MSRDLTEASRFPSDGIGDSLMSDFQGQGAFDCSPLSAQGIDGLCARLDAAARDDG